MTRYDAQLEIRFIEQESREVLGSAYTSTELFHPVMGWWIELETPKGWTMYEVVTCHWKVSLVPNAGPGGVCYDVIVKLAEF